MSKNFAHQIFGNDLKILILIFHVTIHLLVVTRCSIIFDSKAQESKVNKFCEKVGNCEPGEHVMCMYGREPGAMGPRCFGGKKVVMAEEDKNLILKIINGYRSKLARGKETGKDEVPMPRGYGIMRLEWDEDLSILAQVWANQCVSRRDFCRSTENYPNVGQAVGQIRFSYPGFDIQEENFATKVPGITAEKRQHVINSTWNRMYGFKRVVTGDMVKKHSGSGQRNVYILAIYGWSSKVGCAMSSYIDYISFGGDNPVAYYAVEVVCNFSNMPKDGAKVYETSPAQGEGWSPCGCPPVAFEDEDCLCVTKRRIEDPNRRPERRENDTANMDTNRGDDGVHRIDDGSGDNSTTNDNKNNNDDKSDQNGGDKKDDKNGNKSNENGDNSNSNKDKNDNSKNNKSNENGDSSGEKKSGKCDTGDKSCNPSVVLMPIFTIEDADSNKLEQLHGLETSTMNALERRKMQIRQRIRDRVKNVRDRYFNNYVVIEPGTRFSNGGPIDDDTFALSKYEPPNPKPNMNHNDITKYSFSKKKTNINIKPRRDFSNLEELVSEYLLYKHNQAVNSPANTVDRSFNDMLQTETAVKPYIATFDNTRAVNQQAGFENPQRPSIRKLRYGVQGFNYNKAPFINNFNDDHDQLASDLYNLEQKSEDIAYNTNINDMVRSNARKAGEGIPRVHAYPYNNLLRSTKQIRNDNFMDNIDPIDYASDDNEDIPSDIDYDHRTIEAQRELNWPVTRNQNPLHAHTYGTSDFDYFRHFENDKGYKTTEHFKPRSMLMNLADENAHFENDDSHTDPFTYGYSGSRSRPYVYDKNELRNYYFDLLKRARPFKRPKDAGFGQSSEFHRRRESDEAEEKKLRYFVPDRANLVRGF